METSPTLSVVSSNKQSPGWTQVLGDFLSETLGRNSILFKTSTRNVRHFSVPAILNGFAQLFQRLGNVALFSDPVPGCHCFSGGMVADFVDLVISIRNGI